MKRAALGGVLAVFGLVTGPAWADDDFHRRSQAYHQAWRAAEASLDANRPEDALRSAWDLFKEEDSTDYSGIASLVFRAALRTGTCSSVRAQLGQSPRDLHLEALFLAEESSFREAAEIMDRVVKEISEAHGTDCVLGEPRTLLGLLELAAGDERRGRATLAEVGRCKRVTEDTLDVSFMYVHWSVTSRASAARRLKQWTSALAPLEQQLGPRSPWVAFVLARRAAVLEAMGKREQARADRARVAAIRRKPFRCGEEGAMSQDAGRPQE